MINKRVIKKEELIEMFEIALGYEEYDQARLWEIICDNNDLDYNDETIGQIYDEWYEEEEINEL